MRCTQLTKQHCELIEETLDHQAKHQNTGIDTLYGLSHHRNSSQSNNSTSSLSTSDFIKVPPLLHSEWTLLNEHEGCTKCHCFYAGHHSQSCPNGFPLSKGYKTVMLADASATKKGKTVVKPVKPAKLVTTMSANTEEVNTDKEIFTAAAVLPDSPGKYTSDSDEVWDIWCCEVSQSLLCGKHLIWNCQIHSQTDDFLVKTHALIDNGAHLILIHLGLIDCLGLKIF